MAIVSGGFILCVVAVLLGLGYYWGYSKGKVMGKLDGRADGFRAHEDMMFGRIHQHYPRQAGDMIQKLLA